MSYAVLYVEEINVSITVKNGEGEGSFVFSGRISQVAFKFETISSTIDWEIVDRDDNGIFGAQDCVLPATVEVDKLCSVKNKIKISGALSDGVYTARLWGERGA